MIAPILGVAALIFAVSVQRRALAAGLFFAAGWLIHG